MDLLDQDPEDDSPLGPNPERFLRNLNGGITARDHFVQQYILAGARLVGQPANPALNTEEAVALILGTGLLSISKILCEAAKVDPELHNKGKFEYRWRSMQRYYTDLLSYVLRDEKWSHHRREAAKALVDLANDRKPGKTACLSRR
jgi:hypothetical protein